MARTIKIPDATHPITIRPTGSWVTVRVGGVTVAGHVAFYPDRSDIAITPAGSR